MKKVLSTLLVFGLALSMLSTGALAEGTSAKADAAAVVVQSFEDVAPNAWYYEAVQCTVKNALMEGVSELNFAPDETITRAMLATVLYRLDGLKKTDKNVIFTDVTASAWYYDAVEWAAANGLVMGYGDSVYGAEDKVTRQQMAAMFQRYAKYKGRNTENTADLSVYTDASAVADWARTAIGWAIFGGLITGKDRSTLLPDGSATRAETAAILMRYVNGAALEKRTSDYATKFAKGSFNDFYESSSDQLRQSITLDKLLEGWNTITQMAGAPGASLGSIYTKQNGSDIVVSSLAAALNNIRVTISYGSDGKPSGIWTSTTPKDPPTPQSADKWQEIPVTVGKTDLPGMLTLPTGVEKPPVVILIQGSGASDMNEALGTAPNRPFEDIAHGLAEHGSGNIKIQ